MPTGSSFETDGIVINSRYFGITDATAPFSEGKVLTHLVGNFLGLYPLWNSTPCWDDYVLDTPISNMQNAGCPEANHISTCDGFPTEMTMNFMDATDDACKYMFTKGQAHRMHTMLAEGGPRGLLGTTLTECQETIVSPTEIAKNKSNKTFAQESTIEVYPNPAYDYFNMSLINLPPQTTTVEVVGIDGRVVNSQLLSPDKAQTELLFTTEKWPTGIYIITVTSGTLQLSEKITIEKE